ALDHDIHAELQEDAEAFPVALRKLPVVLEYFVEEPVVAGAAVMLPFGKLDVTGYMPLLIIVLELGMIGVDVTVSLLSRAGHVLVEFHEDDADVVLPWRGSMDVDAWREDPGASFSRVELGGAVITEAVVTEAVDGPDGDVLE
ncbi:hypothetical protein LTR04_004313, partial [Oleoguttula sp. CCFEE 6159]